MVSKTTRYVAAFLCLLLLGACSQSITSSYVIVADEYLSDETEEALVARVYQEAQRVGGECSLLSKKRRYHRCQIEGGEVELAVGLNQKGKFGIWVSSTVVHEFPPSDDSVLSGKHVPNLHKELESWALNSVPMDAILSAKRTYVGYGVSDDL